MRCNLLYFDVSNHIRTDGLDLISHFVFTLLQFLSQCMKIEDDCTIMFMRVKAAEFP